MLNAARLAEIAAQPGHAPLTIALLDHIDILTAEIKGATALHKIAVAECQAAQASLSRITKAGDAMAAKLVVAEEHGKGRMACLACDMAWPGAEPPRHDDNCPVALYNAAKLPTGDSGERPK